MKFLSVAALLAASSSAFADAHFSVNVNPFGWGAPPPVVYQSPGYYDGYYAPPPVVYYGGGHWGDHRDHDRGHDRGRHDGDRRH
jgi:hypothetical protein